MSNTLFCFCYHLRKVIKVRGEKGKVFCKIALCCWLCVFCKSTWPCVLACEKVVCHYFIKCLGFLINPYHCLMNCFALLISPSRLLIKCFDILICSFRLLINAFDLLLSSYRYLIKPSRFSKGYWGIFIKLNYERIKLFYN